MYSQLFKVDLHQSMYNCVTLKVCYSSDKNLHWYYSFCILFFILSLRILRKKKKEWMVIIMCEERETIKKKWYFNEIYYKINNLMWNILKSKYLK